MSSSKLFLVVLLGALICAAIARDLSTTNEESVNVRGVSISTGAGAAESKIDISVGLAPPPGSVAVSVNDTVTIGTPGLAPPVSIGTNNTIGVVVPPKLG